MVTTQKEGITITKGWLSLIALIVTILVALSALGGYVAGIKSDVEKLKVQVSANTNELELRRSVIFDNQKDIAVLNEKLDTVGDGVNKILRKLEGGVV